MLSKLELAQRLRVSIGRMARRLRQQSVGGLTPSQASVLSTLNKHGRMTMSDIADYEAISRPSASGIVGRLEEKGLVARVPNPNDLRSAIVDITSEGGALLKLRREAKTEYIATMIDRLTPAERETLEQAVAILERIEHGS